MQHCIGICGKTSTTKTGFGFGQKFEFGIDVGGWWKNGPDTRGVCVGGSRNYNIDIAGNIIYYKNLYIYESTTIYTTIYTLIYTLIYTIISYWHKQKRALLRTLSLHN